MTCVLFQLSCPALVFKQKGCRLRKGEAGVRPIGKGSGYGELSALNYATPPVDEHIASPPGACMEGTAAAFPGCLKTKPPRLQRECRMIPTAGMFQDIPSYMAGLLYIYIYMMELREKTNVTYHASDGEM